MPRIPGPAKRARALACLAPFLSRDAEFRNLASRLRKKRASRFSAGAAQIRNRLDLPNTGWANAYVRELVQHFDNPLYTRTFITHWRPAHELQVETDSAVRSFLVDPESSSGWVASGPSLISGQLTLWPPEPAVSTLSDLERRSNAPRWARRTWTELGLAKGRQPTETLQRDTVLFYLVGWCGLNVFDAALEVESLADAGRVRGRSKRGHKKELDGTRAFEEYPLTGAAVRKAVNRIRSLLSDPPSIEGSPRL